MFKEEHEEDLGAFIFKMTPYGLKHKPDDKEQDAQGKTET
jgi:hypothetical protein